MNDTNEIECPAGDDCTSPYCAVHAPSATLPNLGDAALDDEPDTSQETPESKANREIVEQAKAANDRADAFTQALRARRRADTSQETPESKANREIVEQAKAANDRAYAFMQALCAECGGIALDGDAFDRVLEFIRELKTKALDGSALPPSPATTPAPSVPILGSSGH